MRALVGSCHLGFGKVHRHTDTREQAQEHVSTDVTSRVSGLARGSWMVETAAAKRLARADQVIE